MEEMLLSVEDAGPQIQVRYQGPGRTATQGTHELREQDLFGHLGDILGTREGNGDSAQAHDPLTQRRDSVDGSLEQTILEGTKARPDVLQEQEQMEVVGG
jgi:hypothetical protein